MLTAGTLFPSLLRSARPANVCVVARGYHVTADQSAVYPEGSKTLQIVLTEHSVLTNVGTPVRP